jgi:hypothetical protein
MQINFIILAFGLLSILAIDTFCSLISKKYKIDYSSFAILSFLVYFGIGFFGAKLGNPAIAIALTPIAGLVDSTLGWYISTKLSAYTKNDQKVLDRSLRSKIIMSVTILSGIIGYVGFLVGKSNI